MASKMIKPRGLLLSFARVSDKNGAAVNVTDGNIKTI